MIDTHQNTILEGDCIKILPEIPDHSIDLVIADPPYYIMTKSDLTFKTRSAIRQSSAFDEVFKSYAEFLVFTENWIRVLIPKLKENASFYCFFATQFLTDLLRIGEKYGLVRKNILVWNKSNPAIRVRKTNYLSSYESIIFFVKNYPTFNFTEMNQMHNCVTYPLPSQQERLKNAQGDSLHPTQKPLSLIKHLILVSSQKKEVVCDPFAGTGTTNVACLELGRYCIGIELNAEYQQAGTQRLGHLKQRYGRFMDQLSLRTYF